MKNLGNIKKSQLDARQHSDQSYQACQNDGGQVNVNSMSPFYVLWVPKAHPPYVELRPFGFVLVFVERKYSGHVMMAVVTKS